MAATKNNFLIIFRERNSEEKPEFFGKQAEMMSALLRASV